MNTETNTVSESNFEMTNDILRQLRKDINRAVVVDGVITSLTYERVVQTLGGNAEVQNHAKLRIMNRSLNINDVLGSTKKFSEVESGIMTIELQECAEDNYWHSSQNRSYTFSDNKKVKAKYVHGTEFQPHELRGVRVVIKSVLFGTPSNTKTFYIKNYDGYNKAFGQMYVNDSRGMIETFILETIKNGMDKIDSMMQARIDARKRFVSLMGE